MSKSRDTLSSDTPKRSEPGTRQFRSPDDLFDFIADAAGSFGINGFTYEDPEDIDIPDDDCDLEFLMEGTGRHPVAIICTKHGWRGGIS